MVPIVPWKERKEALRNARERAVELHKKAGTVNRTKMKAQTKQRYKDTHQGRSPSEDGVETTMQFHKGELHEVVLIALQPDGEWDVDLEDRVDAVEKDQSQPQFKPSPDRDPNRPRPDTTHPPSWITLVKQFHSINMLWQIVAFPRR